MFFKQVPHNKSFIFLSLLQKIKDFFLDLLFPRFCLGCQKEGDFICFDCFKLIELNKFSNCFICGGRTLNNRVCRDCRRKTKLNGVVIASSWDNALLRQLVYEYKYRFLKDLRMPLAKLLISSIKAKELFYHSVDDLILIPVPLHRRRLNWRGFNQAELLANELTTYFGIQTINLLIKTSNTLPQAEIKAHKERKQNIAGAFQLNKDCLKSFGDSENTNKLKNKIIIIVDDITTTGSTLEECAKTLKPLKPKEIWGLVLARG